MAALQVASLSFDKAKIDYYLTISKAKKCKIFVLGEYVINLFFKELEKTPLSLIKEQALYQKNILKSLSKKYNIIIIAPSIIVVKNQIKKAIIKYSNNTAHTYEQQILINYKHWNEERFFDNQKQKIKAPLIFNVDRIKCALLYGFEVHFDKIWIEILKKRVDVVIIPTASTFSSKQRWREIIKTRAFLNNLYILRVNRVGRYDDNEGSLWKFYGNTYLVNPDGQIENTLGEKEDYMVIDIQKKEIHEARQNWGFHSQLRDRGMI